MMLFLCIIGIVNVQADGQYDIYFRNYHDGDKGDHNSPRTQIDSIIASTTYSYGYVESIEDPIHIFNSNQTLQLGAKIGKSHQIGSLTINLAKKCQIKASKLAFYLAHYYDTSVKKSDTGPLKVTVTYTDGTTVSKVLTIAEWADGKTLSEHNVGYHNHQTMVLSAEKFIQKIKLETTQPDFGRVYCKYFTIFSAPIVSAATATTTQTTANITTSGISDLGSSHFSVIDYGFVFSQSNNNPTIGGVNVTKYNVGKSYTTANQSFATTLSNLTPGTTYYVRPYATTTQLNMKNDTCTAYSEQTTVFNTRGYFASFDAGTHGTCANPTIEEVSNTAGITLPSVTPKSGYRFLGWSTSNSATPLDTLQAGSNYNLEEDMTFYAVYIQQFTIQWLVDGDEYTTGNPTSIVDIGTQVSQLPTAPAHEDHCGEKFMGWTNAPIIATQDGPPAILFTTAAGSPTINANTIFYAVFADKQQ